MEWGTRPPCRKKWGDAVPPRPRATTPLVEWEVKPQLSRSIDQSVAYERGEVRDARQRGVDGELEGDRGQQQDERQFDTMFRLYAAY